MRFVVNRAANAAVRGKKRKYPPKRPKSGLNFGISALFGLVTYTQALVTRDKENSVLRRDCRIDRNGTVLFIYPNSE